MKKSLLTLCERQVQTLAADAEKSVVALTNASVDASTLFSKLTALNTKPLSPKSDSGEQELSDEVKSKLDDVIISLQFYDEMSQRLSHILKLIEFVHENEVLEVANSDLEYISKIGDIFTVESEFHVFNEIFPDTECSASNESIELF